MSYCKLTFSVPIKWPHNVLQTYYTGWSKSLCAPDDYNTEVRCTETFWSPCIVCVKLYYWN